MARNKAGQTEHHSELQVNGGFNRQILLNFIYKISAFIGLNSVVLSLYRFAI